MAKWKDTLMNSARANMEDDLAELRLLLGKGTEYIRQRSQYFLPERHYRWILEQEITRMPNIEFEED